MRRLDAKFDRMTEEMRELKIRMTAAGTAIVAVATSVAGLQRSMDRLNDRVERIERRLHLIDVAPPL
jgi:ubiquinone biosynthesis protein UbiJ